MVDTISSLASIDYRHDEWGVDVTVAGSQKGLMLPPGLSFNAASDKALKASKTAKLPRSYWSWDEMEGPNEKGFFPYTQIGRAHVCTPVTNAHLVCRLLLEKKKNNSKLNTNSKTRQSNTNINKNHTHHNK